MKYIIQRQITTSKQVDYYSTVALHGMYSHKIDDAYRFSKLKFVERALKQIQVLRNEVYPLQIITVNS